MMSNENGAESKIKKILVLGCGFVAFPCIEYLAKNPNNSIIVAARTWVSLKKAFKRFFCEMNVRLYSTDVTQKDELEYLISNCDVVVSLIPYTFHPLVFETALKYKKHVVTTSYVSEKMKEFDGAAKKEKLIFFNEVGVDPGIDHIYAMKILDEVRKNNGKIESFKSYCGGLPKLEYSYDNPLRYKFSWSSQGVLLALKNNAKFISDGKKVEVPAEDLMSVCKEFHIQSGDSHYSLIGYPNRDSTAYLELYNLKGAKEVIRGTLRFPEFKEYVIFFHKLNLLDTDPSVLSDLKSSMGNKPLTWISLITKKLGCKAENVADIAGGIKNLGIFQSEEKVAGFVKGLEFLGLISNDEVCGSDTILGCVAFKIKDKLNYGKDEADVVALVHEFLVNYDGPKPEKKKITCSAVWVGKDNVNTAMSKTVGVTCGITVQLILDGKITNYGVLAPLSWELASPIYDELIKEGIVMDEFVETV